MKTTTLIKRLLAEKRALKAENDKLKGLPAELVLLEFQLRQAQRSDTELREKLFKIEQHFHRLLSPFQPSKTQT